MDLFVLAFDLYPVSVAQRVADDLFADNTYADTCLDRIIHKVFRLELNGKNMRNPS